MYKVNDTIVYGTQGVCKIVDITEKEFMGEKRKYYVLKPINNSSNMTLFAPTENEAVLAKMRRILSRDEIQKLAESLYDKETAWITNDNERKEKFKEILSKGDHSSLILMIKAIWLHKQKREAEGKKIHISDEQFFKDAEQLLYDEFQYVLDIEKEDLISYLFKSKET